MNRRIIALVLTTAFFSSGLAAPMAASAAQSGVTGDPWVDQYIEQVPTASGGKPTSAAAKGPRTGLSRAQIVALADAGGDRFAAAAALAVAPLPSAGKGSRSSGDRVAGKSDSANDAKAAGTVAVLINAVKGGDNGLGPVLPAVLILSLVGALAFAVSRTRRRGEPGA